MYACMQVCMHVCVEQCMIALMTFFTIFMHTRTPLHLKSALPNFFFTFWSWQMQALDLKTSLAEAKRDTTRDNVTISSLQQVTRF